MNRTDMLNALKGGMKSELDAVNFYAQAQVMAKDQQVKDFFGHRLAEEKGHYNQLLAYYKRIEAEDYSPVELDMSRPVAVPGAEKEMWRRAGADSAIFMAFSVAALLEKQAMDYYRKCMEEAGWVELKKLFAWLLEFESAHYEELMIIERENVEHYWTENRFEPF